MAIHGIRFYNNTQLSTTGFLSIRWVFANQRKDAHITLNVL
jgi:hypothetical protein